MTDFLETFDSFCKNSMYSSRLSFISHGDTKKLPGQRSLFKFLNTENLVPIGKIFNFLPAEEVDDETSHFVHVLTPMDAGSVPSSECLPEP